MDRIEDVTDPVVGRKYLVRCAVSDRDICGYKQGEWVPIQGEVHTDKELGFTAEHIHYDWRFVPKKALPDYSFLVVAVRTNKGTEIPVDLESAEYRPKKLLRLEFLESAPPHMRQDLDKIGRSLPLCTHICPHRGFPLNGVPTHGGLKACPGHFLRFHADTGLYAPYSDAAT